MPEAAAAPAKPIHMLRGASPGPGLGTPLAGYSAMLKIVALTNGQGTARLVLEGQLIGRWVEELRRACDEALGSGGGLTLDLRGVTFIDRDGVELVRSLAVRAAITNSSLFVAEQLRTTEH